MLLNRSVPAFLLTGLLLLASCGSSIDEPTPQQPESGVSTSILLSTTTTAAFDEPDQVTSSETSETSDTSDQATDTTGSDQAADNYSSTLPTTSIGRSEATTTTVVVPTTTPSPTTTLMMNSPDSYEPNNSLDFGSAEPSA